ncbi:MAG: 16S rRNA (guanine(527)-N(7))-methyltransferase RsmG [Xenococcaceae cyanobacterium MO_188.B29]|nr:16S rRNA (guanine(527)-N(7))-methyltransferase RsmG [Xenococcaceae cyanobacterium MO_188.B29]
MNDIDDKLPLMTEIWDDTLSWQPSEQQQQQFQELYQQILLGNRQLNLTRITSPLDFWEKHLWDSLTGMIGLAKIDLKKSLQVIDIGTGGGFPGLPMAIAFPQWTITLLDSTHKKIAFLDNLLNYLSIHNVKTLLGRAETIGQEDHYRESYDLALIRAVGKASVCAEYAVPLVKNGGLVVLYRGHWSQEDTAHLELVAQQLGSKLEFIKTLQTPISHSIRHCIYLRKYAPTSPKFPRLVGVPNQKPL